jgi:hypothetical protein
MSKKPKIDHEYNAGKDKFKITIHGYSLSKKARGAIVKKINVGGGAQPGSSRCRCQEEIEEGTEQATARPAKCIQAD